ncbi:D-alanyl-D-alanine carboxypeptidase family protein [Ruegeria meonggei]|uniref:D-alanyl-D-alanine carboxypeptidase n=1 Tax=Ruegeria meonggei TaxID=1446476 RepID=A0A1X6ZY05_9RHOB|nr:D-alanyl-D-alanine carboxypeptidase family protein [Ruegeria meonggei]SLN64989.1 D-alanyl-D-alanine carboxypeptidase [Ruegeria meonggei]
MSSFFWGQTPTLTPDGAQRKRDLAAQFATQMRAPRNFGEGLTHLGNAWAARRMMDRADKAEATGRASAQGSSDKAVEAIRAAMAGGKPKPYASSAGPMSILGMKPTTPEQEIGDEAMIALDRPDMVVKGFDFTPYAVGGAAARADSFTGLKPEMQTAMIPFLQAADKELGPGALKVTSAYRSPELQAQLWDAALKKYGSPEAARKWVAPPGKSQHNSGTAIDFAGADGGLLRDANSREAQWIKANAAKYGLAVPMGWEPWQVELAGARGNKNSGHSAAPQSPDYSAVYEALANPWLDQGQRSMLMGMLQQAQQQNDPMRQLALEKAQLEVANMRNPQPGFSVLTDEQETQMGLDPAGNYQIGPNGKVSQIGGGGTNVSVSTEAAIPKGFRAIRDEQGRLLSYEPVPGGPEDTSAADAKAAEAKTTSANIVMDEIGIAKELIAGQSTFSPATGLTGSIASTIDSTRAGALKNRLTTIKANIGFDKLQSMRDASPTGGALGQVSEFENRLLQSVFGSLEQAQSEEDILYNLDRLEQLYTRIIHEGIPEEEAREMYRQIEVGGLTPGASDSQGGATDYSTMGLNDLINLDLDTLTPAQQEALSRRFQELGY